MECNEKEKALLSVVIPAYNVEKYIAECIESVIRSSYTELNIIIIDDGSTDATNDICQKYVLRDERIKLITQTNCGVAKTRKNAMKYVTGKYLVFVDADDWVEQDYFQRLMLAQDDFDLVTTGYYQGEEEKYDTMPRQDITDAERLGSFFSNMIYYGDSPNRGITPYIWNKLYKTELAKEVFQETNDNIFWGEDTEFLYLYALKCERIRVTDICGYHYRVRSDSTVRTVHEWYLLNLNYLYMSLKLAFSGHYCKDVLVTQLQRWIAEMLVGATGILGFSECAQNLEFLFPYLNELVHKKIVIYGAGKVGRNYYRFINTRNECVIVGWIDKNWEKLKDYYKVTSSETILSMEFDYVVIAIESKESSLKIKKDLLRLGVSEEKILWKEPIRIR